MAQYYHIVEWEGLPVWKQAALVYGLPAHSRVKVRIKGGKELSTKEILLAMLVDNTAHLIWMQSEDAQSGRNRPESVLAVLLGEKEDSDLEIFDTPEDFERERERILNGKDAEQ